MQISPMNPRARAYYAVTGRNTRGDWYPALGETVVCVKAFL